jgi:hypothetical protein
MGIRAQLVEEVKAHARAHYEEGGWDVLIECYSDAEIAAVFGSAQTLEDALLAFAPLIEAWVELDSLALEAF